MWNKNEWVVVIGGTFNRDGAIKDVSFTIASIVEVGLDDLLVKPKDRYSRLRFVSKRACRRIPVSDVKVYDSLRKPQCGDLVYYYHKDWNKKEVTAVSHVLELRKDTGHSVSALILVENEQVWASIEDLLVLDVNNANK